MTPVWWYVDVGPVGCGGGCGHGSGVGRGREPRRPDGPGPSREFPDPRRVGLEARSPPSPRPFRFFSHLFLSLLMAHAALALL